MIFFSVEFSSKQEIKLESIAFSWGNRIELDVSIELLEIGQIWISETIADIVKIFL